MQENRRSETQVLSDFDTPEKSGDKNLADVLPRSMYLIDAGGRMVRWSPWFRDRIAGYSDSDMVSIDFTDLIHPEDRQMVTRCMRNILEQGTEESLEVRVLLKGGPAFRWFLLMANRYEHDGQLFVTGTGIDITRLKKAKMALMLSEQRFRSMFEQADSPVFITDTDGFIEYVSPAFEKISGYLSSGCLDRHFMQCFEEGVGGQEPGSLILADVLANPEVARKQELTIRRKDGSRCFVELKLQHYHDNHTEGAIGVLYDLTQRKRLESLTEFRLGLLRMAGNSSIEQILKLTLDEAETLTDSTFGFIYFLSGESMNLPKCLWSARVRDHMDALNKSGVHHPFDVMPFLEKSIETRQVVIVNDPPCHRHPDLPSDHPLVRNHLCVPVIQNGQVLAVLLVGNKPSPYDDNDSRWVGTLSDLVWDIVTRKKNEQSESRMQSILLQIQKMELIGQLAGGIAHDFNNMLGVILGNTELALSNDGLDPSVEENLAEIYRAAERSAEMTSQLLAFARKQTTMPRVLDIDEAVQSSLAILQRVAGEKVEFDWHPSGAECKVRIDPSQFDQILMNLCLNARDAMDGKGNIVIEARQVRTTPVAGQTGKYKLPGDYVRISVTDSGKGISEEQKLHIFEPFFTTKDMGRGTGLGLSSIYGIVKQNRGFVDFESEEGQGTTFNVYLPLHGNKANGVLSGNAERQDSVNHATILVVEDEPEILGLCKMMLEKSGFTVLAAACPSEAIMIAEECSGQIDLLLTDIVMPEMNGSVLSSKLATISPGFRVLFMSGYSADILAHQEGVSNPSINVIRKPFTVRSLTEKVCETLDVV